MQTITNTTELATLQFITGSALKKLSKNHVHTVGDFYGAVYTLGVDGLSMALGYRSTAVVDEINDVLANLTGEIASPGTCSDPNGTDDYIVAQAMKMKSPNTAINYPPQEQEEPPSIDDVPPSEGPGEDNGPEPKLHKRTEETTETPRAQSMQPSRGTGIFRRQEAKPEPVQDGKERVTFIYNKRLESGRVVGMRRDLDMTPDKIAGYVRRCVFASAKGWARIEYRGKAYRANRADTEKGYAITEMARS